MSNSVMTCIKMNTTIKIKHNNMKEVNDKNFDEVLKNSSKLLMVDFWAEWCGPCRMIGPTMEEISNEYSDQVTVAKCNVDESPNVSRQMGIRNIPAVLFFKDGKVIDRQIGAAAKSIYINKIKNL